jgi:gamma-glutamylcyclotransferase (GGCT)/AIG2-like uncharacterized protein YtfP
MKLYFAYGANTHKDHMATRCPDAVALGRVKLFGHALAFRGVADVIKKVGSVCVGALWEISPRDEQALDRFEGFPHLYVKRTSRMKFHGKDVQVMYYVMRKNDDQFSPPPRSYEQTLRAGYAHFGMKHTQIDAAIEHAKRSDSAPPFVSKWHRLDSEESGTPLPVTAKRPAKMRPRLDVPSREPMRNAEQQRLWDAFDDKLRERANNPAVRRIAYKGGIVEVPGNWRGSLTEVLHRLKDKEEV